jgi:hypothetical protein
MVQDGIGNVVADDNGGPCLAYLPPGDRSKAIHQTSPLRIDGILDQLLRPLSCRGFAIAIARVEALQG